jgi:hypothetical protein
MLNRLLKKIINTSIGRVNFILAISGLFVSVLLILAALQIRHNFRKLQKGGNQYLVITKRITNAMMGDISKSSFSETEIADLKTQSFFDSVQPMKASLFKVKLDIPLNSLPLNADLFFEAVPDAYLDVVPEKWKWSPGDPHVTGIAPRFLLDMYNYGIAIGQRLPQLSEESVKVVPMNFHISNYDGTSFVDLKGNIGALSSRFGSILVPENFLDWANQRYGFKSNAAPARMVVKAKNPTGKQMNRYLKANGWESDYGVGRFSKWGYVVRFVEMLITIIGAILFGFALLVFIMFIQLTITHAKNEIQLLHTLGAAPKQLSRFLLNRLMPVYLLIIIGALLVIAGAQYLLSQSESLKAQDIILGPLPGLTVIACALALMAILWLFNFYTIRNQIRKTANG